MRRICNGFHMQDIKKRAPHHFSPYITYDQREVTMSLQRVKNIPHQSLSIHEAKVSRSFLEESMLLQQIDLTMSPMTNLVKLITSSFPSISMIYDHKQCPMSHATPISILRGHALVLYLQLANWFPPWFQAGSNNDEEWLLKVSFMNSPR